MNWFKIIKFVWANRAIIEKVIVVIEKKKAEKNGQPPK